MIFIDVNKQAVFSNIRMTKGLEATFEVHDIKHEVRYRHDWDQTSSESGLHNSIWVLYNTTPIRNRTLIYAEKEGVKLKQEFWEFDWNRDWEDYIEKRHYRNNVETYIEYKYMTPLIISDSGTFQSVYPGSLKTTLELCYNQTIGNDIIPGWRIIHYS